MSVKCPVCKSPPERCPHTWKEIQDKVLRDRRDRRIREMEGDAERNPQPGE